MKRNLKIRNASFETQDRFGARQPHFAEEVRAAVETTIENKSTAELIELWNEYCDNMRYYEDELIPMDQFDEMYAGKSPSEIAYLLWDEWFNPKDYYFKAGEDKVSSFNSTNARWEIEVDDLVDYIIRNKEAFYDQDICAALAGRWC